MTIQWKKSTCPYCGVGCGLTVKTEHGRIVHVYGMDGHPVNKGDICALPVHYPALFSAAGRLTQPMIRRDGKLTPVDWDEAVMHVANGLNRIIKRYGPHAVAFLGGAANFTEEYYLINKLMKAAIGTNNVECTARLCMASASMGFLSTFGADAPPACYNDIEEADLFFIAGNNMAVSLPVLFRRVCAARIKNKTKIIVVDPRRTETACMADIHLQIKPGTDVALNNALAYILIKEGYVDETAVKQYTTGLDNLKEVVEEYAPARAAMITGCTETVIREAAHIIGQAKKMLTFWFQGYNQSTQAVFKNNTLHNLSLLTNNYCRPGAGPLSITGEANTLGCRWVGTLSHLLPGMRMVSNPRHRQEVAEYWDIPVEKIQSTPGRSILDIIHGLHTGEIHALWVLASNPAASLPHTQWVEEGLSKAELLIVQDIFHPTETSMLADVVLAGAQWCEKTGTLISSERRIELVEKIVDPPGMAKSDCEIIWMIARAMGFQREFPYASPNDIFDEWKGITNGRICDMCGVSYERLRDRVGLQLPCPEMSHPGSQRLFVDRQFPRPDGRAALLARDYKEPAETTTNEYPFVLITGRLACHFNTHTRTGRIKHLHDMEPDNIVEIHPVDAKNLGIEEDDIVEVISRRGRVRGVVRIKDRVLIGNVFMSMHFGKASLAGDNKLANLVCNPVYDIHSKQPEFKYCAVKISKSSGDKERALYE